MTGLTKASSRKINMIRILRSQVRDMTATTDPQLAQHSLNSPCCCSSKLLMPSFGGKILITESPFVLHVKTEREGFAPSFCACHNK